MPDARSGHGFAATYVEARERLSRGGTRIAGSPIARHVHPIARGAEGEELSIDVAVLGPPDAREVLLLISGTHGAEGFCGSGCQVNLLRDDAFVARSRSTPACASSSCTRSIRTASRTCAAPTRTTSTSTATSATSRTPPPPNAALRGSPRLHGAGDLAAVARERRPARGLRRKRVASARCRRR